VTTPTLPVNVLVPEIDKLEAFRVFVENVKPVLVVVKPLSLPIMI
jgi:hypothetical protein